MGQHVWGNSRRSDKRDRIAYYAPTADGTTQVFIIPSDGSDQSTNRAKRPLQATHLPKGAGLGLRWHPSGNSILCPGNDGIVATCVKRGRQFGQSVFLTVQGNGAAREQLVLSPDGKLLAYDEAEPTKDEQGKPVKTFAGLDPSQIFVLSFPDANGDGVATDRK